MCLSADKLLTTLNRQNLRISTIYCFSPSITAEYIFVWANKMLIVSFSATFCKLHIPLCTWAIITVLVSIIDLLQHREYFSRHYDIPLDIFYWKLYFIILHLFTLEYLIGYKSNLNCTLYVGKHIVSLWIMFCACIHNIHIPNINHYIGCSQCDFMQYIRKFHAAYMSFFWAPVI